jgi:hypothetical protein
MQNTYFNTAELHFWKIITPLMYHSGLIRKGVRLLYNPTRSLVSFCNEVLDGSLQSLFLFIMLFLGGVAFGVGYIIGSWVR